MYVQYTIRKYAFVPDIDHSTDYRPTIGGYKMGGCKEGGCKEGGYKERWM